MMYPLMTLNDDTEIVHSELLPDNSVKVMIETPIYGGFKNMTVYLDIDNVTKISLKAETKKELSLFIEEYYDTFSGIYLKSKDFLKNMKKIEGN